MESKAKIIAVAGKGGVGKTSISASIVRLLVENFPDKKILAIDADPAVGLSVALGVDVKLTLDDIRMSIVDSVENGETREALELLSEARFKIFDALVEMPGFAFLGIGRPESSGCLPQGSYRHFGKQLRLCCNRRRGRYRTDTAPSNG